MTEERPVVEALLASSRFEAIDLAFARFLARRTGCAAPALLVAAALASAATRGGHVCLDLREWAGKDFPSGAGTPASFDPDEGGGAEDGDGEGGAEGTYRCPSLPEWRAALLGSGAVGRAEDDPPPFTPLVLDGADRLYLHRYWTHERDLSALLLERASRPAVPPREGDGGAPARRDLLDRLFPPLPDGGTDPQRVAAERALSGSLTIVSGGPGTGKTTTVAKILALLHAEAGGRGADVALCAPTGKAAARLAEAVGRSREDLPPPPGGASPSPASRESTIHRLLGARAGSVSFRHGPSDPLPHDAVVVDEASMIPLPLMVRLLSALRPEARLVLLGDRDQLVSVEPGKVFGDLCRAPADSPLGRCVVSLARSYRFGEGSGIGEASRLVNAGKGEEALSAFLSGRYPDLSFREARDDGATWADLEEELVAAYGPVVSAATVREAVAAYGRFRVLCAVRRGPFGVEEVNRRVGAALRRRGLVRSRERLHRGCPVLVTRNDYRQGLFNGDTGILFPDAGGPGLKAWFPGEEGGELRGILPGRLPGHEVAWATTVHKSQGSEYDRVLLLLGDLPTAVHTRELVYTGLTRARARADVWSSRELFARAVSTPVERRSGLAERLGGREP